MADTKNGDAKRTDDDVRAKLMRVPARLDFPSNEDDVLALWKKLDAFQTSMRLSEGRPLYTFYDGPPFATGLPHYGHILAGTIKDTVTRFAHQTGHHVSRRFGWDCHGLPVEHEIDKKLKIKGREDVMAMGIAKYNAECRGIVTRYCSQWEDIVTRLGRWIDFKNDYKTMEPWYMESVWHVFKQLWNGGGPHGALANMRKKRQAGASKSDGKEEEEEDIPESLVYRSFRVMPYSTACGTPLSNFEANLAYADVTDPSVVVSFPLRDRPNESFLAWTTTPWTLPSNLALCVHPDMTYVTVKDRGNGSIYILAETRLVQIYPKKKKKKSKKKKKKSKKADADGADAEEKEDVLPYEIIKKCKGKDLEGLCYVPLFDYFADRAAKPLNNFRVLTDTFVTDESGTGIVHMAPAFGEDDFRICLANKIITANYRDLPCPIDANGRFTATVKEFEGLHVKAKEDGTDDKICKMLKEKKRLVLKTAYTHSYPFCWRSDTPLIYRAIPSWYVRVTAIKKRLIENNKQTYWVPTHVKEGRFHNWLADARDWSISRNRYWGTPLPLWTDEDFDECVCVGSIQELEELTGTKVTDLHRESIDHLTITSKKTGKVLKRVDEVFDCWFESGSMPYAQSHYPFENKDLFEKGFPADFIAEGVDQTRGWFYTLMVISTALFDKPPFKNLIVNGMVLASDGKKMSKRLKNYPDPLLVVKRHSADALRMYLISSPVVKAEKLRFDEKDVMATANKILYPWFNAFRFFMQNVERFRMRTGRTFVPSVKLAGSSKNLMDRYILSSLQTVIMFVRKELGETYRLYTVVQKVVGFLDKLCNWYLRLNRDRIKCVGTSVEDCEMALATTFEVLMSTTRLMAPVTPFFTEYLYQNLRSLHPDSRNAKLAEDATYRAESIHYVMIPKPDESLRDAKIEVDFELMQSVVSIGRQIREKARVPIKMPMKSLLVVHPDPKVLAALESGPIRAYVETELNIAGDFRLESNDQKWCKLSAVPNFAKLGKDPVKRKKMKDISKTLRSLDNDAVKNVIASGSVDVAGITLNVADGDVEVRREFAGDTKIWTAATSPEGTLCVALDVNPDEALFARCIARELVSHVQSLRKASSLELTDQISVFFECRDKKNATQAKRAIAQMSDYFMNRLNGLICPADMMSGHTTVIRDSEVTVLAHDKKRAFGLRVIMTTRTPSINEKSVLAACNKDKALVGRVAAFVSSMSSNGFAKRCGSDGVLTVKIHAEPNDALSKVVVVKLKLGRDVFACASDMCAAAQGEVKSSA